MINVRLSFDECEVTLIPTAKIAWRRGINLNTQEAIKALIVSFDFLWFSLAIDLIFHAGKP